ncbi:MAG: site-specific DNA-methyltransferase [Myxococcota bacterium]|nr:site-specific DNA-methyltransferase [Myxococcota bacterium]
MSLRFPQPAQSGRLNWRDKHHPPPRPHTPAKLLGWSGPESHDPNLLYEGNNLDAIVDLIDRGLGERFQLVYLDPPFCSGRSYKKTIRLHAQGSQKAESMKLVQYEDTWDEDSYLQFCYERLLAAKALLHPSGSLILHVDEHMSHMLRCVLDEVFGQSHFVNEIVWHYPDNFQGNVRGLANNHNLLFWYKKTSKFKSNPVRVPLEKPKKRDRRIWDKTLKKVVAARDEQGAVIYDIYTDRRADDVWRIGQSSVTKTRSHEHTGYPTQKPEKLLSRLIEATTDRGDWVFDGFSGSGTTALVAQKLGRKWAVCDQNRTAIQTLINRLDRLSEVQHEELPPTAQAAPVAHFCVKFNPYKSAGHALIDVSPRPDGVEVRLAGLTLSNNEQPGGEISGDWVKTIDSLRIDCDHRGEIFRPCIIEIPTPRETVSLSRKIEGFHLGKRFAVVVTDVYGREFTASGAWPTSP